MTSAVILTDVDKGVIYQNRKPVIVEQIRHLKQMVPEVMVITDSPMDYLPAVQSAARILSYYNHRGSVLAGLHTALTLCKETDIWLLHESMECLPRKSLLYYLQQEKQQVKEPAIILPNKKSGPYYGLYDKKLLPMLNDALQNVNSLENILDFACYARQARGELEFMQMNK
ncbi:hypothetical protein ACFQPF_06625 [Fictibacillus iocasae]|uniref:MobA-like NTP transferase domain-containing protein n=1 Tax=Fictibacillus iocasae TaxID=2715437 RepID=A0ABW2NQE7_9BACL